MKKIYQYIVESLYKNGVNTKNNIERQKELEKYLKGKEYGDYIKTLNNMLKDDKTKALLIDGFGGDLGDLKLQFKPTSLKVTALVPTQSEIDIQKSINYVIAHPEDIYKYFKNDSITLDTPIVTFKGEFIIDGHHRWAQLFIINPQATIDVFDYSSDEINSIQMLKTVQGAIAAVKAEKNNNNGELPVDKKQEINIYKLSKDETKEYVIKVLSGEEVCIKDKDDNEIFIQDNGRAFIEKLNDYVDDIKSVSGLEAKVEAAAEYIANNVEQLKTNNSPIKDAPESSEMPQVDKSSPNGEDDEHFEPNDKGSALNKLKDDKIASKAVK